MTKSFCRLCIASCGIDVDVDDGRVVRVRADADHAMSRGYLCTKGRQLASQVHGPNRLTSSLRRAPDGGPEPIPTETALDEIAERLRSIVDRHGPDAVASFVGTALYANAAGVPVVRAWHRALGSRNNFSTLTIDQASKIVAVMGTGVWGGGGQSFETADVAMIVGNNPPVSGLHTPGGPPGYFPPAIVAAKRRGLRLIVVDPRATEVARQADIHLQVRPGQDPALLAGMLHVILSEGLEDREFCARHVSGLDALRRAVGPFTPELAAARAGVAVEDLVAAARMFAAGPRGMVSSGTGPDMAPRPHLAEHLISCLNYACGRVAREGEAVMGPSILTPDLPRLAQAIPPEFLPPDLNPDANADVTRVRGFRRVYGELPTPGLADEILTPGEGQVRALVVVGANPVLAIPDQDKVVKALDQLEVLVTLDIAHTPTTRRSHYVVACAHSLERADLAAYQDMNFERPFAQYTEPVLDRSPEVLEEWEVFAGLARRMGTPVELPGGPLPLDGSATTLDVLALLYPDTKVPVRTIAAHEGGHVFDAIDVRVVPPVDGWETRLVLAPGGVLGELDEVLAEPRPEEGRYGPGGAYTHLLVCRRLKHVANTVGRDFPRTLAAGPYNPAFLHPDDLAALGFAAGEVVELESEHGAILGVVEPDPTVRRGVVSMAHGFGDDPESGRDVREVGSATTRLVSTDEYVDPLTGMTRQSAIPVRMRAVDGAWPE